ncbi:Dynein heavy chain 7, axonemal [Armadillidium vulgare]|nr:Dynein heavy chain 7, axonemal [Armadillidium vulgare]
MINAELDYGYEYLGNTGRLVITSLTDRCYRTLTQALNLHLGGAPEGPAGTGKTETSKDLAKAVAKQCVVFNCSDGLDYISLAKFFKVKLDPTCAIFITMNPTYAGRSVAMMVPDYGLIAEISLYSYGFVAARVLAKKIVATYRLCSEQLSSQPHYDYGMRTVKAVLVAAGTLKLQQPELPEAVVVLSMLETALISSFVMKACNETGLRANAYFLSKIQQLYETMRVRHGFMLIGNPISGKTAALRTLARALGLMKERGEGEQKVQMTVINPKSISPGQLYGQFDPISHEWSDGVLAVTFRKYAVSSSPDRKWIILDGPVDAVWIENINSVLDDNKKLCLNSGEIISLSNSTSIIFEVNHLENASPATVSRCGMVYLEPMELGWKPLVETWLSKLPKTLTNQHKAVLTALFHRFIPPLLTFVRRNLIWLKLERTDYYVQKEVSPTTDLNLVMSLMNIFDCFAGEFSDPAYTKHYPETDIRAHLESIFLFSAIWSLGGPLDEPERKQFDVLLRQLFNGNPDDELMKLYGLPGIPPPPFEYQLPFPDDETVFDYKFVKEGRGYWQKWSEDLANAASIPRDILPHQIMVPTVNTVRVAALLNLLVAKKGAPVLMVGPPATGKSTYIMNFLQKLPQDAFKPLNLSFSAQTSASNVQELVMGGLDKRKKGVYGPPIGKKCIMFIDDLNLPQPDEFGSYPPLELIRQLVDYSIWYHISKEVLPIHLEDMQLICAMSLRDSGKINLTPRLLRHFNIIALNDFDNTMISSIYSKILLWHLDTRGFSKMFDPCIKEIVDGTLDIYRSSSLNLRPTPTRAHYIFNLRDYSRVIQGVLLSVPETMSEITCMKKLWVHEIIRVFYDRLVDSNDREWLLKKISEVCSKHLHVNFNELMANLDQDGDGTVNDLENLREVVESFLQEFNNMSKKPMNLVMFKFALEHLCRISRVLRQPRGHALLVGVGGSGRHSLTRLAAHIADYELFEVRFSKVLGYDKTTLLCFAMMSSVWCSEARHTLYFQSPEAVRLIAVLS